MIVNSQRTLYGVDLALHALLNIPYKVLPNTSLNEKFGILTNSTVPAGTYPTLKYWAIGTGGNSIVDTGTGFNYSEHGSLDAALFNQIPFVMKRLADDVDATLKDKYRFRKVETIENEQYACYYLKLIPNMNLTDQFYQVVTKELPDKAKLSQLYLVDLNNPEFLNPTPKDRLLNIDNLDATTLYYKLAKLEFNLSEEEVEELKKVMDLRKIERGQITEIAACTGIETTLDGRPEVMACQVNIFFGVNLDLTIDLNKKGQIAKVLEIGGGEGLMG